MNHTHTQYCKSVEMNHTMGQYQVYFFFFTFRIETLQFKEKKDEKSTNKTKKKSNNKRVQVWKKKDFFWAGRWEKYYDVE